MPTYPPPFVLLDDARKNHATLYRHHVRSEFLRGEDNDRLDEVLQRGWQDGLHVVMLADYGYGRPFQALPAARDARATEIHAAGDDSSGHPPPGSPRLALHWFRQRTTDEAETALATLARTLIGDDASAAHEAPAGIDTPHPDTSEAHYLQTVRAIQAAITEGDVYQINYTIRLHLRSYGHPLRLYQRLRQPVPYGALACVPDAQGQSAWTLCFSPELFLRIDTDGTITTEPMKGTAPALDDGHDAQRAQALKDDPKNRAENLMIVDLMRNDLGRIARTGGVRVPALFSVERFGTVQQMTSTIQAEMPAGVSAAAVFRAAFPCGSVTGAPKRAAMQHIDALESAARGLYTGSIGFLAPCTTGLGFHGVFNVVIRTLQLKAAVPHAPSSPSPRTSAADSVPAWAGVQTGDVHGPPPFTSALSGDLHARDAAHPDQYDGIYGVGSGIVSDSVPEDEYRECAWKARFLTKLRPDFSIFETMRVAHGRCDLLPLHLARLQTSARQLNLPFSEDRVHDIRHHVAALPASGSWRMKVVLAPTGQLAISHAPLADWPSDARQVLLTPDLLPERDYLRRFKTTRRTVFDDAWQHAASHGAFDSLFFNRNGILLEGGRSTVFVRLGRQWHTPALDLDILDGVMRRAVLQAPQHHLHTTQVHESHLSRPHLLAADEIRLCNALRGMFAVTLKT